MYWCSLMLSYWGQWCSWSTSDDLKELMMIQEINSFFHSCHSASFSMLTWLIPYLEKWHWQIIFMGDPQLWLLSLFSCLLSQLGESPQDASSKRKWWRNTKKSYLLNRQTFPKKREIEDLYKFSKRKRSQKIRQQIVEDISFKSAKNEKQLKKDDKIFWKIVNLQPIFSSKST